MAEDILAGKIVPVGCLAQFQALGPKADWLPFQTLQFGYRLGLVGARAVVELMVDREQRGLLLTKTELRLASLREDELEEVSLLFTDSEADLSANRVARAFWRWWILRALADYWTTREADPIPDMEEFQMMWDSDPEKLWKLYYRPRNPLDMLHFGIKARGRFARRIVQGVESEMFDEVGSASSWFDRVRGTIAYALAGMSAELPQIPQSVKFQAWGPETDGLSLDTLQFGYRIGLIDARSVVKLMADRKQRNLPLTETELRLASLPDNELYEIPLIFNDPETELRTNSAARTFWRWWILSLLLDSWKSGPSDPLMDLGELEIAWDYSRHVDGIEGNAPISEPRWHCQPGGRGSGSLKSRARAQFFEKFEQWLNDNQPTN
ncbi:MAG: hypothetical protein B5766_00190 [Candidatus Lumbricidophila eiseniae]|uniref:Uncharacterized protein n=1 Tax=Candidatus Lumbricidiphila eiseniae TaxID=1969409 RepID=A0A2A6FV52_9MICO|nr:MAG: hypothetical protein B5766_00190 [Candidatus Lumbricidophila eiseniae]